MTKTRRRAITALFALLLPLNAAQAANSLSPAKSQSGMSAAIDACLVSVTGKPARADDLKRNGVEQKQWYDGPIIWSQDLPLPNNDADENQLRIQVGRDADSAVLNGDEKGRVIYQDDPMERRCAFYLFKSDISFSKALALAHALLEQKGWVRTGRSSTFTKNGVKMTFHRSQIKKLLFSFSLRQI